MRFVLTKVNRVLILLLLLLLVVLSVSASGCIAPSPGGGCGGPAAQGWSGFTSYDGILYFGSMDGAVMALDPAARSRGVAFPGEREWVLNIRAPAASGAMCGLGCVPAASPVNIYGTPVVAGDLLCVATYVTDSGKVIALNRSDPGYREGIPSRSKGEWVYPSETKSIGAVVGSPIAVDGTLYVGSSDGKVYALDAVYGERKWEFDTGGKVWTSPAVSDGVVYVGNYGRKLCALSSHDGRLLWEIKLPAAIASSPVISGDNIFFGTFDRYLYAVDKANGEERWKFEGGNWFWAAPIANEGVVYAGCLDHKIYALEASSGKELWQFVADSPIISRPVLIDDFIIVISELGEMYVLESDSGVSQRVVSTGYSAMAPLYAEGSTVYVHARDGNVYSIDVQSGKVIWSFSSVID